MRVDAPSPRWARLKGAKPYAAFEAEIAKVLGKKKGLNKAELPTGAVGVDGQKGIPNAPSVVLRETGKEEAVLFLDLQDAFGALVLDNALKAVKQSGWKGTFRVAPLIQSYHEEGEARAVTLLSRKASKSGAAEAFLKAVLAEPKEMGAERLNQVAKRSGLGGASNTEAWTGRMKASRKKLAEQNVIVSPTLYVSEGKYTGEGGFDVEALTKLFEGKTEVKR